MQSLNNYGFSSEKALLNALFAALSKEGFECNIGLPIAENKYGQRYSSVRLMVPASRVPSPHDVIFHFQQLAIANFTHVSYRGESPSFDGGIDIRSIDLAFHPVKKDQLWFYLRGAQRDESRDIKYFVGDDGVIQEVSSKNVEIK